MRKRYDLSQNARNRIRLWFEPITPEQMEAVIRREAKDGVKVFAVDSVSAVSISLRNGEQKRDAIGRFAAMLNRVAQELNLIIYAVSHVTKQDAKDRNLVPAESLTAGHLCSQIWGLWADKDKGAYFLRPSKNKQNGAYRQIDITGARYKPPATVYTTLYSGLEPQDDDASLLFR
jgi:predicted ATP-dependent serine protease